MPVETSISVILKACESIASENQAGPVWHTFDAFGGVQLTNGTAAGQADKVWSDRRTLGAGATDNLDLAGSVNALFGGTVTFAKVKAFVVYNRTAGQTLTYKKANPNGFAGMVSGTTDGIEVETGGFFFWYAPSGKTVTAGTGDLFSITNSAGSSCDYDIFVVGTSA